MSRYEEAKKRYAQYGIDTDAAIERLKTVPVSLHCWQGDDVGGFDSKDALSGGILTTGNYPGKAATPEQLMQDMDKAMSLCPGKKKLNLHAAAPCQSSPIYLLRHPPHPSPHHYL